MGSNQYTQINRLINIFPEVAKEWHLTKNKNIDVSNVPYGSNKLFWWKCSKGHSFQNTPKRRTGTMRVGCPYSNNRKACLENCLNTKFPEIAKEWHPLKNFELTPKDVTFCSSIRVWWKCCEGHEWETRVWDRTNEGNRCPFCYGKNVTKKSSLSFLFPEIAKEWSLEKNGSITPNDVFSQSNKYFWWKCGKGHEWEASVSIRTRHRSGCPYCLYKNQEKVRHIFQDILNVPFVKYRPKFLKGMEFDGANKDLKIAFEYDGEWHFKPHFAVKDPVESLKRSKERDLLKDKISLENGWTLLRVSFHDQNNFREVVIKKLKILDLIPNLSSV